ncbi:MAG: sulfite exporter TauE/SafE family protein, partial [Desulfovibrio sp.]|nr:sulfite exporter TauE/SafE family protein [Desulfovibrio sp.]
MPEAPLRISIRGMTCPHCEQAVEKALASVRGVASARASFSGGWGEVTFLSGYGDSRSRARLEDAIRKAGYQTAPPDGEDSFPRIGTAARRVCALAFVALAFCLLERALPGQWTGYFPSPGTASSLWALFGVGLLTSLHCLAMCGGIAMTQGFVGVRQASSVRRSSLCYQAGRLISYSAIGGLVGSLGAGLTLTQGTRGAIMLAAGVFMLLMALNMMGFFAVLRPLQPRPPRWLSEKIQSLARERISGQGGWRGPLLTGIANGLMPCG